MAMMLSFLWTLVKCGCLASVYTVKELLRQLLVRQKSLAGEVILVTGGGTGLGRKLALAFAEKRPKHIILWGRNVDALEKTRKEIGEMGVDSSYYQCDVSCREEIYKQAAAVQERVGSVSMLVNNAGVVIGKPFIDLSPEEMQYSLQVNTLAHVWTIKAFLPGMIEGRHGHIVCINSMLGLLALKGNCDYSTTKFATTGLMESVSLEVEQYAGIHTTVIHPYQINNPMFSGMTVRFPKLFPPLKEESVVENILVAILTNRKLLVMPILFHPVLFFRSLLPVSCIMPAHKFLGLDTAMDNFHTNTSRSTPIPAQSEGNLICDNLTDECDNTEQV